MNLGQGADAVGNGGGGHAEFAADSNKALVSGGSFEKAQAFERGQEQRGE